ncbi:hypothetical protein [Bradyrhizobium amphicarpaeae]|uniref:hypothetical protein n=1 Tax=Bradyrhizobium amphicarpaeae TaxID=1404768 RepID=UPI0011E4CFEA|nr:hypothetical protein [Bradyrhizobium amphicarpaeae]
MFTWIREKGFKANIAEVRREHPQMLTFAGWVKKYTDEHWPKVVFSHPRGSTRPSWQRILCRSTQSSQCAYPVGYARASRRRRRRAFLASARDHAEGQRRALHGHEGLNQEDDVNL